MAGHVVPQRTYFLIFAALVTLTITTTVVAFVDLGPMNTVVALAIAVCKACLVVLFFMHIKYAPGLTRVVVLTGFLWLALLIGISLSDVVTRPWTPVPQSWQTSSASQQVPAQQ